MPDLAPTAADVISGSAGRSVKFGEAAVALDVVYYSTAGEHWLKAAAGADNGDTSYGIVVSSSVAANQHGSVVDIADVVIAVGAILTAGEVYALSANSGKIKLLSEVVTGEWVFLVGAAVSGTELRTMLNRLAVQMG